MSPGRARVGLLARTAVASLCGLFLLVLVVAAGAVLVGLPAFGLVWYAVDALAAVLAVSVAVVSGLCLECSLRAVRTARASDGALSAGPIAEAVVELGAYTLLLSSLGVAVLAAPLVAAAVPSTVFALLVLFVVFYLLTTGYVWAAREWVRSRSEESVERSATGNWLTVGVLFVGYLSLAWSPWAVAALVVALAAVGTASVAAPGLLEGARARLADLADEDPPADEDLYGITDETSRLAARLETAPGPRPAVTVVPLLLVGLASVYAAATRLPPEALAGGTAVVAAVGFLSVRLGRAFREEFAGDVAVLRDLEHRTGLESLESGADDPTLANLEATLPRLAGQADVPVPTLRLAESRTPTALTVGYRPSSSTIVLSRGLVGVLSERELEAVLAHELAHVANRDAAVLTALAAPGAVARLATDQYGFNPVVEPLAMLVGGASRASVAFVARAREYAADDGAVAITGDPAALAGALETLDADLERRPETDFRELGETTAFSVVPPAWEEHRFFDRTQRLVSRGLFGTHPPTKNRIERLRTQV